jgi:hypothetical protein
MALDRVAASSAPRIIRRWICPSGVHIYLLWLKVGRRLIADLVVGVLSGFGNGVWIDVEQIDGRFDAI